MFLASIFRRSGFMATSLMLAVLVPMASVAAEGQTEAPTAKPASAQGIKQSGLVGQSGHRPGQFKPTRAQTAMAPRFNALNAAATRNIAADI